MSMAAGLIFSARRQLVAILLAMALAIVLLLTSFGTAFADAAGGASCMGQEASAISPPGSSGEIPTGVSGLMDFIDAAFPDVPPGAIFSTIAKLHEPSHEACDEALE
jgi:hypothetical protein